MKPALIVALALAGTIGAASADSDTPARYLSGDIPRLAVNSVEVGGGEVLLEATIAPTGAVTNTRTLRATATFTERMVAAVTTWRFAPAESAIPEDRRKPDGPAVEKIPSKVLVAGVFRRPSINAPTLGEPIKDIAAASNDVPYPTSIVTPPFPISALNPGTVLVEVEVDGKGGVTNAKVRVSAAGFDSAALDAARAWKFRPAKAGASVAYIVFGFPIPRG